jgi:hypothetical protein
VNLSVSPSLHRLLPIVAVGVIAIVAVLLVARGLGGGSGTSAQQVLDRALQKDAASAEFNVRVTFGIDNGGKGTTLVNRVVTGSGNETAQRRHFSDTVAGKDQVTFDELASGGKGYIQVDGRWYELSDAQYQRVFPPGKSSSFIEALGFDPRRWMRDPKLETAANVGGVEANHLSGAVDANTALADLGFYEGAATPAAKEVVAAIKASTKHGTMDLFAGKQDGILRKLAVTAQTDPAHGTRLRSTLTFALGLDKVNQPVKVEAPTNALPPARIASIPRSKLGDEADDILGVPTATKSKPERSGHGGAARKHHKAATGTPHKAKPKRSEKAYVNCVQAAEDLAALDRCQPLLPAR